MTSLPSRHSLVRSNPRDHLSDSRFSFRMVSPPHVFGEPRPLALRRTRHIPAGWKDSEDRQERQGIWGRESAPSAQQELRSDVDSVVLFPRDHRRSNPKNLLAVLAVLAALALGFFVDLRRCSWF